MLPLYKAGGGVWGANAAGYMLQILAISAFPEINYEFSIFGQKVGIVGIFLEKSRKKVGRAQKSRKSRKKKDYL